MVINHFALLLKTLLVHKVVIGCTDVGVGGDDESAARVMDLLVHVHDIILAEAFVVEFTVLVVLSVLSVEPEDIDGEAKVAEVLVSLDDLVSGVVLPLGEVVSKRVHGWHWSVSSKLRKFLLELLGVTFGTHKVELKSVAFGDEGRVGLLTSVGVVEEDESLS